MLMCQKNKKGSDPVFTHWIKLFFLKLEPSGVQSQGYVNVNVISFGDRRQKVQR